jgi:hypothetical protein
LFSLMTSTCQRKLRSSHHSSLHLSLSGFGEYSALKNDGRWTAN